MARRPAARHRYLKSALPQTPAASFDLKYCLLRNDPLNLVSSLNDRHSRLNYGVSIARACAYSIAALPEI